MNFSALTVTSPAVIIHLLFALAAFVLGGLQLATTKGTLTHRILGYIWVAAMVVICLTSFGIKEVMPNGMFGGYSPIHLLSVFVLVQLGRGIYFAKNRNIKKHRRCMLFTYIGGLLVAGAFTFMPGRLLFKVVLEPWLQNSTLLRLPKPLCHESTEGRRFVVSNRITSFKGVASIQSQCTLVH